MKRYKNLSIISGCLLGLAILSGCDNQVGNVGSNTLQNSIKSSKTMSLKGNAEDKSLKDGLFMVGMGSGYDMSSHTATSGQSCLSASRDQNNMNVANPTAIIKMEQEQSLSTLQNNLGVDVSGKYGGDRFSMSVAAQFATDSKDSAYSTNIIYLSKYTGFAKFKNGALNQGDAALTPVAAELVHHDQTRFRQMCGNSYIEQMDAGAVLGVRLTLSFNSHADQQKFMGAITGQMGLSNIATTIKTAADNSNVHVNFSLSAIQQGGQPEKLNDIFGQIESSTGNYPFVDCGSVAGADAGACNKMTSNIIKYANTLDMQLTKADGSIDFDRLYYTNPVPSDYNTLGIQTGAIDPSSEVLQAMQSLTSSYDKTMYDYQFVTHYLTALSGNLDLSAVDNLKDSAKRLGAQLHDVYQSPIYKVLNCYKGYVSDDCINIKNNVGDALKSSDFALEDFELQLIDYLEKNSYETELYVHDLDPASSGFHVASCILAPISAPSHYMYGINCDGKWMKIKGKLQLQDGIASKFITISGLNYSPIDGGWSVRYQDTNITRDVLDPNYYSNPLENIYQGVLAPITESFKVIRLHENQA